MLAKIEKVGENLFSVPSKSMNGNYYIVDMSIGRCECFTGTNGAPCIHQFILWSKKKISSDNFLSNDREKRQLFAFIAFGSTLDISYYESLHSNTSTFVEKESHEGLPDLENHEVPANSINLPGIQKNEYLNKTAMEELEHVNQSLKARLLDGDIEYSKAVLKFCKRYQNLNENQRKSSLHSFGGIFVRQLRSRIKVQPTAVSRRKSQINSRQKQNTTKTRNLPLRILKRKREHNISKVIMENVPSAKKAGRSMKTNTNHFMKKKTT